MFKVRGVIQLTSPLHIAAPESSRYSTVTGKITRGKTGGMPITTTTKQTILNRLEDLEDKSKFASIAVTIIPANSIRGRLRRAAAEVIKTHLLNRNETLTTAAYLTLMSGSPNGYPDSVSPTVAEFKKAQSHPFFGIFGGGPRMIPSRLKTDTCYPINENTIAAGLIPIDLRSHETIAVWNQAVTFRRVDDTLTFQDKQIFDIIDDSTNAIEEWRDLTKNDKSGDSDDPDENELDKDGKKEKKPDFRGVRSWTAHEIVSPGTRFTFETTLNSDDDAQKGLFLRAIENFANLQNLGGWVRNGYGRYNMEDLTLIETLEDGSTKKYNLLKKDHHERYFLDTDVDTIENYLFALEESLEDVTAAELEELSAHIGKAVEKKKIAVYKARKKKATKNKK